MYQNVSIVVCKLSLTAKALLKTKNEHSRNIRYRQVKMSSMFSCCLSIILVNRTFY
jgi:hypothetical protein